MGVYVKGKELREEIVKCKEKGELSPLAIEYFMMMTDRFSYKFSYKNPMDREDCKSAAMEDLLRYWKGYDPVKSYNAFAYYTQIIKNGFAKGWRHLHPQPSSLYTSTSYGDLYSL